MEILHNEKTINLKIVYAGPAVSGKTTNLQQTFNRLRPEQKLTEKILEIPTDNDGILQYEFASVGIGSIMGYTAKFGVYTVPGQIYYAASRKIILNQVDGVVFVADSQASKMDENLLTLIETKKYVLEQNRVLVKEVPLVIQFNKQDTETAVSPQEMAKILIQDEEIPWFAASAIKGEGVIETFSEIIKNTLATISRSRLR